MIPVTQVPTILTRRRSFICSRLQLTPMQASWTLIKPTCRGVKADSFLAEYERHTWGPVLQQALGWLHWPPITCMTSTQLTPDKIPVRMLRPSISWRLLQHFGVKVAWHSAGGSVRVLMMGPAVAAAATERMAKRVLNCILMGECALEEAGKDVWWCRFVWFCKVLIGSFGFERIGAAANILLTTGERRPSYRFLGCRSVWSRSYCRLLEETLSFFPVKITRTIPLGYGSHWRNICLLSSLQAFIERLPIFKLSLSILSTY